MVRRLWLALCMVEANTWASADDILQRLSPFLRRNAPLDILDLWPNVGLWSSKVNDFLQPRRHVLVEPQLDTYDKFLRLLVNSKPCYECLNIPLHRYNDWGSIISKHLPEQGPSNSNKSGALPKNDTLLVLANLPGTVSAKDHYNPAGWWAMFMENCMRLSGLSMYGSVRLLATMPTPYARSTIPRSIYARKRGAILTESVASHAFEVAATHDPGSWIHFTGWDVAVDSAAHVSKKSAKNEFSTPPGREPCPIEMAPESPDQLRTPCPHVPRPKTPTHDKYLAVLNPGKRAGDEGISKLERSRVLSRLNMENRQAFAVRELATEQATIDHLVRLLSRDAADPNLDSKALSPLVDKIERLQAAFADTMSEKPHKVANAAPHLVDSKRAALSSGSFEGAVLEWDRRPFEPLHIAHDELSALKADHTMLYFEPDANSPVMKILSDLDSSARDSVFKAFDGISLTLGSRRTLTVPELAAALFPNQSTNGLVRAVPGLAAFAFKRLKPDFDHLPKTIRPGLAQRKCEWPLDPAECFQENMDYDLSNVRVRILPATVLWEIAVEYQRHYGEVDIVQVSRALGGSLTPFRSGENVDVE